MKYVFISYVGENSSAVKEIASILKVYDIEIWLDKESIQPGSRWKLDISKAISKGAFFLACFSKEYFGKSKTYMNEELILAIEEMRLRPHDKSWFIPLKLNDCEIPDRPIGAGETLSSIQYVDLSRGNWNLGIEKLLSAIKPSSEIVYKLTTALESTSSREKIKAADNLGKLGRISITAYKKLTELIDDSNDTVVAAAIEAIGKIGEIDKKTFLKILAKTPSQNFYSRAHANWTLVKLSSKVVPFLIDALKSDLVGPMEKDAAIHTLADIGFYAVPEINKEIQNITVRWPLIKTLYLIVKWYPEISKELIPYELLIKITQEEIGKDKTDIRKYGDPNPQYNAWGWDHYEWSTEQEMAILILGRLKIKQAIPTLIQNLNDAKLFGSSVSALGKMGDPIAIKPLLDVLFDQNRFVWERERAALEIGSFGSLAFSSLSKLEEALEFEIMCKDEYERNYFERWNKYSRQKVAMAIQRIKETTA